MILSTAKERKKARLREREREREEKKKKDALSTDKAAELTAVGYSGHWRPERADSVRA